MNKLGAKNWFSEHGSLSLNLIGQNGCLGGMRLLRDSGSQFQQQLLLYGSSSVDGCGNCKMPSICTQNFKSKFASLKTERLILCIPLNAIENEIGEKF